MLWDGIAGRFGAEPGDGATRALLPIGIRIARSDTVHVRDLAGERTQSWDDCFALADLPAGTRAAGLRSQITTQFVAAGTTHVLTLASREPTSAAPFGPEDHGFIELLASFFARQFELDELQNALRGAESHARDHAERLEALWQIASNPTLVGSAFIQAVLDKAAASIRPTPAFRAFLGRIEGDAIVVIGLGDDPARARPVPARMSVGDRKPLAVAVIPSGTVRTQAWEDLAALADPPLAFSLLGWRAVVSSLFDAGEAHYVLTFASDRPASMPFTASDHAYVGLLASAFEKQLEVNQLTESLRNEEELARQHAERLEAMWQIANNPTLRGAELMLAMLQQAAAGIRAGQSFTGVLGRIEGDTMLVIALGSSTSGGVRLAGLQIGDREPLTDTIRPHVDRTRAWDDLDVTDDAPEAMKRLGWRAVVSSVFDAGGERYTLTFSSQEPASKPFTATDLAYVDVVASSFAKQLEVNQLEDSMRIEEEQSRHHAERLEALWKLINDSSLDEGDLMQAMLAEAAAAIRPHQNYRGMLWRVRGADMVIEGFAQSAEQLAKLGTHVGAAWPLRSTIAGRVIADGGGIRSWNDIRASGEASLLDDGHETRALIITTFTAGATTWGLSFSSEVPATKVLGSQDRVYIDVLASFFANHVQQRWQFERIQYQQSHDVLTGLLNRSQFRSQARAAARNTTHFAIVLIDIDAFREINDSHGHMIGDALLVEVSSALRLRASSEEIVGRIGDDVFGIYIGNATSREFVLGRAASFAEAFTRAFSTGDRDGTEFIARTAGIGVAIAPEDGTLIDAVLANADAALIHAKKLGRGSLVLYQAGMEGDAHRRTALRHEIAEALAEDQFELYYQPHVEIETGEISGCEALIRWNHPTRGLLLPKDFIPFAEQTGIITSIDAWVMQAAFAVANELGAFRPNFRLYFNLSGRLAGDPKIIRAFTTAARNGVRLAHLGVEITETDAMRDVEATRHVCRALRRLNVRIAIDDFGTGYSSLSSLKQLPVDIVKIDRSFVSGVTNDPHDATIADTIISIAARFGFESLAEGVEELGEIDWLRQRPVPVHARFRDLPSAADRLAQGVDGGVRRMTSREDGAPRVYSMCGRAPRFVHERCVEDVCDRCGFCDGAFRYPKTLLTVDPAGVD